MNLSTSIFDSDYYLNFYSTKDANNLQYLDISIDNNENEFNDPIFIQENNNSLNNSTEHGQCVLFANPIEQNINKIKVKEEQIKKKEQKLLGRKTKDSGEIGAHGKYSEDNMTRKIKVILKKEILGLSNSKIKELNLSKLIINNKEYEKKEIQLLNIKQDVIIDTTIDGNKKFLDSKIKEILSEDISANFTSYPSNFNALLIEKLYEIENAESVTSILDKTILDALKYYRNDDIIKNPDYACFKGLEKGFDRLKGNLMKNNDEKYADKLIKFIKEFEIVYNNKKPRSKRAKKLKI